MAGDGFKLRGGGVFGKQQMDCETNCSVRPKTFQSFYLEHFLIAVLETGKFGGISRSPRSEKCCARDH